MFNLLLLTSNLFAFINQNDCSNHGDCLNSVCSCNPGYTGLNCSQSFCLHGKIKQDNTCSCDFTRTLINGICQKKCRHGNYSISDDSCSCNSDWGTAGITDTINYIEGSCTQFKCKSNVQCKELLGISSATCPFPKYNCLCPISKAGFDNDKAKCAGIIYTISWEVYLWSLKFYKNAYMYFLYPFLACLIFGQNRSACTCHSGWSGRLKVFCNQEVTCRGECTSRNGFSIRHDFALSIWVMKMCIFTYAAVGINDIVFFGIESFILWACLCIAIICGIILACAGLCNNDNDNDNECDVCICGNTTYIHESHTYGNHTYTTDYVFVGRDPYPDDTLCCSNDENCKCCCCTCILAKILYQWLYSIFPRFPDNLWGGILGVLMGTHSYRNSYVSGNCFIDFMSLSWMNRTNYIRNNNWRASIKNTIYNESNIELDTASIRSPMLGRMVRESSYETLESSETKNINGVKYIKNSNFNASNSKNYSDVLSGTCSICMENSIENFCYWTTCGHIFCKECTMRMINKRKNCRFPCPFCRQVSNTVKKFNK